MSDKESYGGYSVDDEDQPQSTGDSLVDNRGLEEPLDEGYSPPEKWSAGQKWGNTPLEEELGETIDQRLEQEEPEPDPSRWVAKLEIVEHLRRAHGIRGALAEFRAEETECLVTFKGPGYSADAFFDPATGSYELTIVRQGAVGILNDLHRGRDAGAAWAWVVDLSGAFLTFIAITGIGLLWYLKKLRVGALATMVVGVVVTIVLMKLAT